MHLPATRDVFLRIVKDLRASQEVSGHDFSRADSSWIGLGFSPCALPLFQVHRTEGEFFRRNRQAFMIERRTSMKRFAIRSVWNRDFPPAVREVAKNVRGNPFELLGSEGREGFDIAGAKALVFYYRFRHDFSCSVS
jgi:hypothetical protein